MSTRAFGDISLIFYLLTDETKTRILVSAEVSRSIARCAGHVLIHSPQTHVDSLFFPDAVATSTAPSLFSQSSPDDIATSGGSDHPFSAERIYDADSSLPVASHNSGAMDAAGEIGDSLTQESLSEVYQDLDSPYRPNVSSYDSSAETTRYSRDEAREEKRPPLPTTEKRSEPHPSAATPSFQSLAIFTGELGLAHGATLERADDASRKRRGGALCVSTSRLARDGDELSRVQQSGGPHAAEPSFPNLGAIRRHRVERSSHASTTEAGTAFHGTGGAA